MDEAITTFHDDMGPLIARRNVSRDYAMQFKGRLPDALLDYWVEHGWCGFAEGRLWIVDPADYSSTLEAWLEPTPFKGTDDYFVIARSAFGNLYVWGKKMGLRLTICPPYSVIFPRGEGTEIPQDKADFKLLMFLAASEPDDEDLEDASDKPLFSRALKSLGQLEHDEMYGFVPALQLGGRNELKNLKKVKIIEHLAILVELETPRVMSIK